MDEDYFLNEKNPSREMQRFVVQLYDFWSSNYLDNEILKFDLAKDKKWLNNQTQKLKYYNKLREEIESEVSNTDFALFINNYEEDRFYFTHKKHSELSFYYETNLWRRQLSFKIPDYYDWLERGNIYWKDIFYDYKSGGFSFSLDLFFMKLFLQFDYTQLLEQLEKEKKGGQGQNIKYDFSSLTIQIEEEKRRQIVNAKLKEISTNAISAFFSSLCKNKNIAYNIEFKDFKFHVLIKLPKKLMLDFSVLYEDFSKSRDEIKNLIEESLNLVQKNKIKPIIKTYGNNIKWQCETEENDVGKN